MSTYAVETKKRKFDRLLDSLTDKVGQKPITSPPTRIVSTTSSIRSTTGSGSLTAPTTLRQELVAAAKRRKVTPLGGSTNGSQSLATQYLPSSRSAFLERLETYRHITKWHIPSTIEVNAAIWAKRGWICADIDTVSCPSCSQRVVVDLNIERSNKDDKEDGDIQKDTDEIDSDGEAVFYTALVERYAKMIVSSHAEGCPWRTRGCDESIQRIENLLNTKHVLALVASNQSDIDARITDVPDVQDLPVFQDLIKPENKILSTLNDGLNVKLNVTKLAVCGWQYKDTDVVECHNCFRSLGLWLYRGSNPTIEHLDAVESHLEYCPWRSAAAQYTEANIRRSDGSKEASRVKLPAWALLYHVVDLNVAKSHPPDSQSSLTGSDMTESVDTHTSSESRSNKTKELLQRIKSLRRPFHGTSLLRKKA